MQEWVLILLFAVVLVAYVLLKGRGQLRADQAREFLRSGALLIDVRTPEEFRSGHLAQAINIPLDQIQSAVPVRAPRKDQVLLLHCQSGMRSGAAQRRLRGLGYTQAYNLGSFGRAAQIVGRRQA